MLFVHCAAFTPLLSQAQDGLLPCRTVLTVCLGVEKGEQLFLFYKYVLLLVHFAVCRNQGRGIRSWNSRTIISVPD